MSKIEHLRNKKVIGVVAWDYPVIKLAQNVFQDVQENIRVRAEALLKVNEAFGIRDAELSIAYEQGNFRKMKVCVYRACREMQDGG